MPVEQEQHAEILEYFKEKGFKPLGWVPQHIDGVFLLLIQPKVFCEVFLENERHNFPARGVSEMTKLPEKTWAKAVYQIFSNLEEDTVPPGLETAASFIPDVPVWLSIGIYLTMGRSPAKAKEYIIPLLAEADPEKQYKATLPMKHIMAGFKYQQHKDAYKEVIRKLYLFFKY